MGFAPGAVLDLTDAIHISVADDSSCALRRGGEVVCWGENGLSMIDTTSSDVLTPRAVAGLDGATSIAVGGDHVCAVIDGRVGCRGRGGAGQLGAGTFENSTHVVFSNLDDVESIEAGFTHTCAIRATGEAMCWGGNEDGVLGDGTREARSVPTPVASLDDAIAISTDERATCVTRRDGSITCWGWGARGLLGDGRKAELGARAVPGVSGAGALAAGRDHTCASIGNQVQCWGSNRRGQLGLAPPNDAVMAAPQVVGFAWPLGILQLVAGDQHTCALLENATVYCWGANSAGQIGDGTGQDQPSPTLASLPPTARLASGLWHTCALDTVGVVRCWGHNDDGQIGDGTTMRRDTPVMVASGVDEIATGDFHTCARIGGAVSCWGSNGDGELGDGTQFSRPTAQVVAGLTVTSIVAGGRSTCVQNTDTTIACWGLNASGVLNAPGAMYSQTTPIASGQLELFVMGGSTACVDRTCWGENAVGQVGAGGFGSFGDPTDIVDLPTEAATMGSEFAISSTHTCTIVVGGGGQVWCWGENASGEIGVGSVTTSWFPATTVAFP